MKEGRKGVRIGSVGAEKKNLACGRGQTKLTEQCPVPWGTGNVMRGTKS